MEELIVSREGKLPATLDDLSKFVLIGREKLVAVRAEIRAIEKVGLAQEVRKQKLKEAQDIADTVLDAEVRIGELMAKVPKASYDRGNQYTGGKTTSVSNSQPTKTQVIEQSGFTPKQVQRFETLAAHPEIVEQAKVEARDNDDIVSRSLVLNKIREKKQSETEPQRHVVDVDPVQPAEHKPQVSFNSGNNEWYTPAKYVELARKVLGEIDVDPASCDYANKTIKAKTYYTIDNNGLDKQWNGKVWMNPPYAADLVQKFTDKMVSEFESGNTNEAIVLVNNATETQWFNNMIQDASAVAFPNGRIRYESTSREMNTPIQGQAFIYFGDNKNKFCDVFKEIGWVAVIQ